MPVQDYELLLRVRADLTQAIKGLDSVRGQLDRGTQSAERFARQGNLSATAMRALGAAITAAGVARLAKDYLDAADASSNMAAKLRLVTDSAEQQVAVQKALFAQAQQTRSSYEGQVELYVRLAQSSDQLRKNQGLLLDMTKLVSQTLVLSGADTAAAEGAVRQFAQAMASGTLRGDEFNSVMEASPRLAQAVADGLNVPKGALRQLAAQGKLTADQVIAALSSQSQAVQREFDKLPLTVGGAVQQVRNSLLNLVGDADGATGASKGLAQSISDLSTTLQSPTVKAGFQAIVQGLVDVANYAAQAVGDLSKFRNVVADTLILKSDQNKSLDKLYDERAALQDVRDTLAELNGSNDALVKGYDEQIGKLDELISKRREAAGVGATLPGSTPSPGPATAPGGSAPAASGVIDAGTVTVFGVTPEVAAQRAAQAAQAMTAANDKLRGVVDALRTQTLSPTAKIWDDYTKAVRQAAEAGSEAIAKGADVGAVQQQVAQAVAYAAQVRDSALTAQTEDARKAYQDLLDTIGTPANVQLDEATAKLNQFKAMLDAGAISAEQFAAAREKISQNLAQSVNPNDLPTYGGLDAVVGGAAGELYKAGNAAADLEQAYQDKLARLTEYLEARNITQAQYDEQAEALAAAHAERLKNIEASRAQATLAVAQEGFANLAGAMRAAYGEQSKQYRIAFALSKAAAIAQAILAVQQSIANSSKIGFPWNVVTIAAAVAQGAATLATIRSTQAGFAEGGMTPPGGKYQVAGVVHAGEGVFSQEDIARLGGPAGFHALRAAIQNGSLALPGYATGGFVSAMTSTADFPQPRAMPAIPIAAPAQGGQGGGRGVRIINVPDKTGLKDYVTSSEDEEVIVNVIGRNKSDIRALLGI